MIKRWPCHVRDRHAGKITNYNWSTNTGSAKERTMTMCFERGRIHAREAGLRGLGRDLGEIFGRKADIAVVERGGLFDAEPWLPI
jgi:hypothetical protein